MPRPLASSAQPLAPVPTRLVFLGDSISAGWGALDSYGNIDLSRCYARMLYSDFQQSFPGTAYVNVAVSGSETDDILHSQLPKTLPIGVGHSYPVRGRTVVAMTIGGNDVKNAFARVQDPRRAVELIVANLSQIVAFLQDPAHFPDGTDIYLATVYDVTDGVDTLDACLPGLVAPGLADAIKNLNSAYAAFAQRTGITLVDAGGAFYGHGFHYDDPHAPYFCPDDPTLWLSLRDCIHPNNLGHVVLRQLFSAAMGL